MEILPCTNDPSAVDQIEPTVQLLKHLDSRHPKVLQGEGIDPTAYHGKQVFRSAVETIRGQYIATTLPGRHGIVANVLEAVRRHNGIAAFSRGGGRKRYDFEVVFTEEPRECGALEVKGGEGNSINISDRPSWAVEFVVWCHLDGSIKNPPSAGVESIIFARLVGELVKRRKQVDCLVIKDRLCGTAIRPCPKHGPSAPSAEVVPDIFLFPRRIPTEEDPAPPVHTLDTTRLPKAILDAYGVPMNERARHLWEVHVQVSRRQTRKGSRLVRLTRVTHETITIIERQAYV